MTQVEPARQPRPPSLTDSLVAVALLIVLVAASFLLFGEDAVQAQLNITEDRLAYTELATGEPVPPHW